MFNGLVREIAKVKSYQNNILSLIAKHKPNLGDSIAVNGACLSVVEVFKNGFALELSKETRSHIALENLKNEVHIEAALRYGERIDGHLLQGHIDGIGEILSIVKNENGTDFFIKIPANLRQFMAEKGSVGVDGVSLTINEVLKEGIRLTLIPITLQESLFKNYKIGRRVNIESDLLARYIARIMENKSFKKDLSWQDIDKIAYLY